jgi:catechol 2,3-dioxygenase-like lactoylglutathione lyase family enzyme
MANFQLKKIQEIVIITADLRRMVNLFCKYGGWTLISTKKMDPSVLAAWKLPKMVSGTEAVIQYMDITFGRIRFVQLKGVKQERMRPATKIWDTGGIADIDIRVHNIYSVYNDLADRGWSGAAVPMELPITDFKIEECLVSNADSMMIALAKRHFPPLELVEGKQFASHIYLSAMVVKNLEIGTQFFTEKLGFQLVNDSLSVAFPPNSPTNFGVPHNFSDQFQFVLSLYSPDGTRDTMCECIEIKGLSGHDYSARCTPPNRGILSYRVEVVNIVNYLNFINANGVEAIVPLTQQEWSGVGVVQSFIVESPDGAWVEFFEIEKKDPSV